MDIMTFLKKIFHEICQKELKKDPKQVAYGSYYLKHTLKEVQEITNQLATIDECISNKDIIENILNSLPKSYEGFVN